MINQAGKLALKSALFARRKKLGRAVRSKPRKHVRWLYPWSAERRYSLAIRAWLKPLQNYVHEYLKNNHEALLRGDSAALAALSRQDEIPGGSYSRMVKSMYGWYTMYLPPVTDTGTRETTPVVLMGLGQIAETMSDFNGEQWSKTVRAELGVEFPVYETWWPTTKQLWQEENYTLIQNMGADYIKKINRETELAVTGGKSVKELIKSINGIDESLKGRASLIARDQIGKLNGRVTQARMEAVGLAMYEWSTSMDEGVRDSHAELEGKICEWSDSTVYSDDGKEWKDRPSDWCQLHPGQDYQCRCTALAYWQELVDEVDTEIDEQEGFFIHDPGDGDDTSGYSESPNLGVMVKEFGSREGQKIDSLVAETIYVRNMGIAAGNKIEFGTFIQDGIIMQFVKGKSDHVPISPALGKKILKAPDNSVVMIHFHPSGSSFSEEDIATFGSIKAFSELRITTASGITFTIKRKSDSLFEKAEKIKDLYEEQMLKVKDILQKRKDIKFDSLTEQEKGILVSRGVSKLLAVKYRWEYKEDDHD
ncbi:MAG: minor capsid protein [Treponema sp.]|jgi:SPP1 gp7 family putative phage head morphogenesis protein|nr:minor capsid protein [Treponema sp.]